MASVLSEEQIIESLLEDGPKQCLLATGTKFEKRIGSCIFKQWKKWSDASSHSAVPPDYLSDKLKMMFDVLNVFDSQKANPRSPEKVIDSVLAAESKIENEIVSFMDSAGINYDRKNIFCICKEDGKEYDAAHNYCNYRFSVTRAIGKHIEQLPLYKKNHPGYKCGLLICDNTEAYIETNNLIEDMGVEYGYINIRRMHYPWLDESFIKPILGSGLDFPIWYMPYKKYSKKPDWADYPMSVVMDLKYPRLQSCLQKYIPYLMRPL